MHVDPTHTDAFNALLKGQKWWVSMPKDLYEYPEELTCLKTCSDGVKNFYHSVGLWFTHILPQIRKRTYYGQHVKSYLQNPGETIFMPHLTLHAVWNLSPTIAIGDNPLYQSSFIEFIGSDGYEDKSSLSWIRNRVEIYAKKHNLKSVIDVMDQVEKYSSSQNTTNYKRPTLWGSENTSWSQEHWKIL